MKVDIRRLTEDAVLPKCAYVGDAGMDIKATSIEYDDYGNIVYHTGIAVAIPEGYVGLLFPKSRNYKKHLILTNCVGVLDSGYRGEIIFKYRTSVVTGNSFLNWIRKMLNRVQQFDAQILEKYEVGDDIGQLVVIKYEAVEWNEVDFLYPSQRGERGFGSSGNME